MVVRLILAVVLFPLALMGESPVIPRPTAEKLGAGRVVFNATWCIVCEEPGLARVAARTLGFWTGIKLDAGPQALPRARPIWVTGRSGEETVAALGTEGYRLEVFASGEVRIESAGGAGAFYGLQTLVQLFQNNGRGDWELPVVKIEDAPRFKWRGVRLDDAGRPVGKEAVKRLLNVMALYKMNTLHWRLADAAHWRVESRVVSLPRDAEGFYSRAEIRELVAYAAERHICIVPELAVTPVAGKVFFVKPEDKETLAAEEKRWAALWTEMAGLFPGGHFQLTLPADAVEEKPGELARAILRERGKQLLVEGRWRPTGAEESPPVRLCPVALARPGSDGPLVVWTGDAADGGALASRLGEFARETLGGVAWGGYGRMENVAAERELFPAALVWAETLWNPGAHRATESFSRRGKPELRFLSRLGVAQAPEDSSEAEEENPEEFSKNSPRL